MNDKDPKSLIPKKRLFLIISSLCIVSFLAAYDNMIISSNTPLIASEFNGFGLYNWVNTAFLLTASTSQPIYAKGVDIFGRRPCFLLATGFYLIGAVICGAAQSMIMLIVARALCGLGIGAFDTLMKIVVADYIPVRYIGTYQSMLGISWGIGYIVGALVGGVAAENTGWRSVFWIALGFCLLALVALFFAIEQPTAEQKQQVQFKHIDLLGISLWTLAVVCLVLALSWGGTSFDWRSPVIISLLCVALALILLFGLFEQRWAKDPIVPFGIFANRSTLLILWAAFCYGGCFQSLMTYVPLYLSVIRRENAMATNLELLCLVLFACIFNVVVGLLIVRTARYTWATRVSLAILVLACALLHFLQVDSSRGLIVGLMIITGVGSGGMINSEIITAQASVPLHHVPSMVAFMTFCDQVGGITGITAQGSILSNYLLQTLQALPIDPLDPSLVRQSSSYLWSLPPDTQAIVTQVYLDAIKMSFWGSFAFAAAGLLASLALKAYPMREELVDLEETIDLRPIKVKDKADKQVILAIDQQVLVIETEGVKETIELGFIYGAIAETLLLKIHVALGKDDWKQRTLEYTTEKKEDTFAKHLCPPVDPETSVVVLINPCAGRRGAAVLWKEVVQPILKIAGFCNFDVRTTTSGGRTRMQTHSLVQENDWRKTILLILGGDGTVHEAINGLLDTPLEQPFRVGVIPAGSGNAFSMGLGIEGPVHATLKVIHGQTQPCGWMDVRLGPSSPQDNWQESPCALVSRLLVVMSWGFHAQIVSKARYLQYFMGNRRFSLVAAGLLAFLQQYPGDLVLKQAVAYNKTTRAFSHSRDTLTLIDKPFTYFIASKQPSLEKGFDIAPFASPLNEDIDVVLLRQATAQQLTEASRQAFQQGKHVDLPSVEYYKANELYLRVQHKTELCLDGEIHPLPAQGVIHLKVMGSQDSRLVVFV
ncbi:major facilitator superfamily-domain-containing protein [Sporodiniella umbellata]|nr:major facilitator superfamily-domain-containing protein [Sporodiniella umbellata]